MQSTTGKRKPGRPPRPELKKESFPLRLTIAQDRDLSILQLVMETNPDKSKLIRAAIDGYIRDKVKDPVIGPLYRNALKKPDLRMVD